MLKPTAVFLFILFVTIVNAQHLQLRTYGDIRAGFRNNVQYSIKLKYDSVSMRIANGSCEVKSTYFIVEPTKAGNDTLYASFYRKKKVIHRDTAVLEIIKPEVFARFSSDLLHKLTIADARTLPGVIFSIRVNHVHWESVSITSYKFNLIRNGDIYFSKVESSARFSEEVKNALKNVRSQDLILISEIKVPEYLHFANPVPTVYEID